jgi:hypothetical protein
MSVGKRMAFGAGFSAPCPRHHVLLQGVGIGCMRLCFSQKLSPGTLGHILDEVTFEYIPIPEREPTCAANVGSATRFWGSAAGRPQIICHAAARQPWRRIR